MNKLASIAILFAALVLTCGSATAQSIVHVDANAAAGGDGSSWASAFVDLQDALGAAAPGDEIWVAAGTYRPSATGYRSATFLLPSGVRLLGGFEGTESNRSDRSMAETILSGDLAQDDSLRWTHRDDNVFHIVTAVDADATTLLDGFTITGGYAVDAGPNALAAVADSVGAGILLVDSDAVIQNVTLAENRAYAGGGLYCRGGVPTLVNVVLTGNRARRGGAVFADDSDLEITSSTVANNFAETGAGIFNRGSDLHVTNAIAQGNRPPGDPASELTCEQFGYPCTYGEVSLATRTRTRELAAAALEFETTDEKVAWLRAVPEVEEADGDQGYVRFRITGGRPNWIVPPQPDPEAAGKRAGPAESAAPLKVGGHDWNQDGWISNRDGKRALILDPFNSVWGLDSDGQTTNDELVRTPGYEPLSPGQVTWLKNTDVTRAAFASWDEYDFVHVATHGATFCKPLTQQNNQFDCRSFLSTGTQLPDPKVYPETVIGPETVTVPFVDNNGRLLRTMYFQGVGSEWFTKAYAGKGPLERTWVFLNACDSYNVSDAPKSPAGTPDYLRSLIPKGTDSGILIWTDNVPTDGAHQAAVVLYNDLLHNGRTVGDALANLRSNALDTLRNSSGQVAKLRLIGDEKLRVREVVFLLSNSGDQGPVKDGASLGEFVKGTIGDGEDDELELFVRIDGVEKGELGRYRFQFLIDGNVLGGTFSQSNATVHAPVPDTEHSHVLGFEIPAGRDFESEAEVDLEVVAELPDDEGESRYEVTLSSVRCFWELNMGGTYSGIHGGDDARFYDYGGTSSQISLTSTEGNTPLIQITGPPLPDGASGPWRIGGGYDDDGFAQLNFTPIATGPPFLYETGDSQEVEVDNVVVFTEPPPSTMTITSAGDTGVTGDISGQVWAITNFDLNNPSFETATWTLRFKAENGLNPDGSPNLDACQ